MDGRMEISPEGLLKRFSHQESFSLWKDKLSTPQLSDALKDLLNYSPVIPGVKPLKDEYKILGKIITVKTCAHDWGTALKAIELAEKGDILFIDVDKDDVAVWGELTSKNAQYKGIAGTVIYGAVRDVAAVRELDYPVFSRSIVPNAGAARGEGEVNVPLQFGDMTVNPGDVVLGDDCGVVVVPGDIFPQAIRKALEIKEEEKEIAKKVENGYSLANIVKK
jgi:3-hexulose-6-phosphate synthase